MIFPILEMNDDYSISGSYVSVSGGGIQENIKHFAVGTIGDHPVLALMVIIALVAIIVVMLLMKYSEHFNPTQNLRDQDSDQFGLGRKERLDQPDRSQSAFAQTIQSTGGGSFTIDPNAKPGDPGSLAYQVLHSSDFHCSDQPSTPTDAWSWMYANASAAQENMRVGKPKTDSDFSKVLSGQ